jgi:hypothetical protein
MQLLRHTCLLEAKHTSQHHSFRTFAPFISVRWHNTCRHDGDEPLSDALYTLSFAIAGLREAYGATGNRTYLHAESKLAEFLVRTQVVSTAHPELSGAWFRAFVGCAVFTMDSAVLGLASLGCSCCTLHVSRQEFTLEDAIEFHAFCSSA